MPLRRMFFVQRTAYSVQREEYRVLRGTRYAARNTRRGFTLLEILLTLALFGVGVVGIAGLFGYALDSSLDAEYTETAVALAQAKMEEIRNIAYASIANEAKAQVAGFSLFQRQVGVTESPADLKQVTVTVYWQFRNKEVNEQLVTYVSKN